LGSRVEADNGDYDNDNESSGGDYDYGMGDNGMVSEFIEIQ
jgi:hypothetical protein